MDFSRLHTYTPPQCAPDNTGYTYSLSSSYSTAALEFEKEHQIPAVFDSPRMSRRSLRLQTTGGLHGNDGLAGDHSLIHSSSRKESRTNVPTVPRTVRDRKQQSSVSQSLSLSQQATPRKTLSFSAATTPASSYSSASHGALLSSGLEHSSLRQRTTTTSSTSSTSRTSTVEGHCGSGNSAHLKGRSSREECSSSGVNGDASASVGKVHAAVVNGYTCQDCAAASALTSASPPSSIYCRDKSRRTGVLASISNACVRSAQRLLAPVVSLGTLLLHSLLWVASKAKSQPGKAHSSYCGSMNVKDVVTGDAHLTLNGSLCDDCKGEQHSETHAALHSTQSRSWSRRLRGALWSLLAYTGYCLLQSGYCVGRAARALGSGVGSMFQRLGAMLWALLTAPVRAGSGVLWCLGTGWYQLVSLMSLLNVFFLTRCLPKLWRLLLLLLPFLLLLGLWFWGPSMAALLAYLPAVNLTGWRAASPLAYLPSLAPVPAPLADVAPGPAPAPEAPVELTTAAPASQALTAPPPVVVSSVDVERLERLEARLASLWERVQQGDQREEQRQGETLGLYSSLKEQLHSQTDRDSLGLWVSGLLEQRLGLLRGELEQENGQREQGVGKQQQSSEAHPGVRLEEVEVLLGFAGSKTEEVQQKQQEHQKQEEERGKAATLLPPPPPVSVGVEQEAHDALLAEVQRLEVELGRIRQDLQGVMGCQGKCEQLGTLHQTVSAQVSSQVREELKALFYGGDQAVEPQGELPEALLLWLSKRYVAGEDLRAALATLELSILRNVSLQLEQSRAQTLVEAQVQARSVSQTVMQSVQHSGAAEGLSKEQVQLIVQNALKLYSQDRTGLVDYALESGGGSILSTRCSETYETKTALMSLFGLPLWYFSQSPRVVIQPDVYPGNCWAFKGSQGYLVIRLSMKILPTAFCLEHIPKALSPTGNISSAPRNFTVYGLDDEHQEGGTLLGHYVYQDDGESLQTFPVTEKSDRAFQIMEVRVLSNWGHPEYTCLYRLRVHGEPHVE
ncbi:SUN domain-containing protein 1 [Aplochiton taeniatus]